MTCHPSAHDGYMDAFGLDLTVEFPLPGTRDQAQTGSGFEVRLQRVSHQELARLRDEPRLLRNLQAYAGRPYVALASAHEDMLFHYGWDALFHLSADHRLLRCAFTDPDDRGWQRVLLDTVLWSVSLEAGFELLHASAVQTANGVIALAAARGGGKSSLAAEFLKRGAALFSDDIVALAPYEDALLAYPGPPLTTLPRTLDPESLGTHVLLGEYGDECWLQLGREQPASAKLCAVVVLNRAARLMTRCSRIPATTLTLLPYARTLPYMEARNRHLFEVFSTLALTTPVFRLDADPSVPTSELADRVDSEIRQC